MNFDHEAINVNQLRLPESWLQRHYFVYVMANQEGMFRTGVTANLGRRVYQIQARHVPDFSDSWQYEKLVYFEQYLNVYKAVVREAEIAV